MIVAAVPVKDLVNAKQRLMRVLAAASAASSPARCSMTCSTALGAAALDQRLGRDPRARGGRRWRASLGAEPPRRERTTAATPRRWPLAQAEAVRQGATAFLTIPGDVPCVTRRRDPRRCCDALTAPPAVVLAVALRPRAPTASLLAPPDGMRAARSASPPSRTTWRPRGRCGLDVPIVLRCPGSASTSTRRRTCGCSSREGAHTDSGRLLRELADHRASGRRRRRSPVADDAAPLRGHRRRGHPRDRGRATTSPASSWRPPRARARRWPPRDVLVVSQKIVSKSEGRLRPAHRGHALADGAGASPPSSGAIRA